MSGYSSLLLKTGRTTSSVTGDDGDLEKGVARSYTTLTSGQYSGTTDVVLVGATDTHSNNCVQDNVTGLMWLKDVAGNVGVDFGKGRTTLFPWTPDGGIGIFQYKSAANTASLAGYTDWRIPNLFEAISIMEFENIRIISSLPNVNIWTSTVLPGSIEAFMVGSNGLQTIVKTDYSFVMLVRGNPIAVIGSNVGSLVHGAGYYGDIAYQQSLYFTFSTNTGGTPYTLAGSPILSVYKDDGTTQTTTGPTLVIDFDGVTGLNSVKIVTTDAFYTVGHDYFVVITTGTVNDISAVGYVVGSFSIENRSAATPTEVNTEVDTAFTTQIADSYAAHEALPTREQALLEILQFLTEKSVSGTTVSIKKPDGSTAVMEFMLDSATAPTSITRKANP